MQRFAYYDAWCRLLVRGVENSVLQEDQEMRNPEYLLSGDNVLCNFPRKNIFKYVKQLCSLLVSILLNSCAEIFRVSSSNKGTWFTGRVSRAPLRTYLRICAQPLL